MSIFKWYTLTRKKVVHFNPQNDMQLGEHAEAFYQGLQQRRLNAHMHIRKILALQGAYSRAQITEDAQERQEGQEQLK